MKKTLSTIAFAIIATNTFAAFPADSTRTKSRATIDTSHNKLSNKGKVEKTFKEVMTDVMLRFE